MKDLLLHIVYLRDGRLLVTRRAYTDWREIQDAYEEYMASLGPWPAEVVVDYLREEYPSWFTAAVEERLREFLDSDAEVIDL